MEKLRSGSRFPQTRDGSSVAVESVFQRIQDRIQPDGGVDLHSQGKISYAERIDLSRCSQEQQEYLQFDLAKTLYNHVYRVWGERCGDKIEQRFNERFEPAIALEFSRLTHENQFLQSIVLIVKEEISAHLDRRFSDLRF
jgi:hypothetical protein